MALVRVVAGVDPRRAPLTEDLVDHLTGGVERALGV